MTGAGDPGLRRALGHSKTAARPGTVIWITGLSGAGKSVLGRRTYQLLRRRKSNVVLLDGDEFREVIDSSLGHDPRNRLLNARRLGRLCRLLSEQGIDVVCATMSLFAEIQRWNREQIRSYFEVYLRVPLPVLIARDARGLYSRARSGRTRNVVGIDLPFDEPRRPDLVLENDTERRDFTPWARRILRVSGCLPTPSPAVQEEP